MIRELTNRLATVVTGHRGPVLVLLGVTVLGAGSGLSRLKADFTPQDLFRTYQEQRQIQETFRDVFGDTESALVVLVEARNVLDRKPLQYIHELSQALGEWPVVDRVESLTASSFAQEGAGRELIVGPVVSGDTVDKSEVDALRRLVRRSRVIEGRLVSPSRRLAAVVLMLKPGLGRVQTLTPIVDDLEAHLAEAPPPPGVAARVGGLPHIRVKIVDQFREDQFRLLPLCLLVSLLILWLSFRWLAGAALPAMAVLMAVAIGMGTMGWVGEPVSILSQMVPTLIIIIGMSDSIHLISRYLETIRRRGPGRAAGREATRSMALACLLTSVTTAVGFASLVVSGTGLLQRFGVTAALGVLIAYAVTITFLPACLTWTRPKAGRSANPLTGRVEAGLAATTRVVLRHPIITAGLGFTLLGGAIYTAVGVNIDTRALEAWRPGDPLYDTTRLLERELDGILPLEVSLESDVRGRFNDPAVLNALDGLADWAEAQAGVLSTSSYADHLHEAWSAWTGDVGNLERPFETAGQVAQLASLLRGGTPNPADPFVTLDGRRTRLHIRVADVGARATIALGERLQDEMAARFAPFPDVEAALTGDAYVGSKGLEAVTEDLLGSVGLAFVVIFGIMTLLFRSLRVGLLSVPPNVVPLVVTMAYMRLRGIDLNTTTMLIFSVSIGLAVDDTIHFLSRFREESRKHLASLDEALVGAARGAGRPIVVTSVMLVAGLLMLLTSSFVPVLRFGELISVTVAGCLLGDLLLLPALLKLGFRYRPEEASEIGPAAAIQERSESG